MLRNSDYTEEQWSEAFALSKATAKLRPLEERRDNIVKQLRQAELKRQLILDGAGLSEQPVRVGKDVTFTLLDPNTEQTEYVENPYKSALMSAIFGSCSISEPPEDYSDRVKDVSSLMTLARAVEKDLETKSDLEVLEEVVTGLNAELFLVMADLSETQARTQRMIFDYHKKHNAHLFEGNN